MAEAIPTFLADDGPPPTSYIQTGKELRIGYVLRKESVFIFDYLANKNSVTPVLPIPSLENIKDQLPANRNRWRREAESAYPQDGDYIVYLVDDNGAPIPVGELVEYVGGTSPNTPGSTPCTEYIWDLSGVIPSLATAIIVYRDCYNVEHTITDIVNKIGPSTYLCMGHPPTIMNMGVLVEVGPCDLTYRICTNYFLDLTGLPSLDPVSVGYIDCNGVSTGIVSTVGSIPRFYCAQRDTITASVGTLDFLGSCV